MGVGAIIENLGGGECNLCSNYSLKLNSQVSNLKLRREMLCNVNRFNDRDQFILLTNNGDQFFFHSIIKDHFKDVNMYLAQEKKLEGKR